MSSHETKSTAGEHTKTRREDLALARACAEEVLLARITPLVGKDYKDRIPALRARVAAIRAGEGDALPEVESAIMMASRLRAFASSRETK